MAGRTIPAARPRIGIAAAAVATVLLFPPVEPRIFLGGYGAMLVPGSRSSRSPAGRRRCRVWVSPPASST